MTTTRQKPLTDADARSLDRYWRAANYLAVGQIYLMTNPLLAEPLRPEHIKPRLLGHWGTSPGPRPGPGPAVRTLVITAREDIEIARQVPAALGWPRTQEDEPD